MSKRPSGIRLPSKIAKPSSTRSTAPPNSSVLTENTDDFIVGDRVFVGGTKPGHIQFIGDTKFAPGEWAGVVLDEPIGKNDGSLGGTRYFMCEPNRGVFSRLTKLTRHPVGSVRLPSPKGSVTSDGEDFHTPRVASPSNGSVASVSSTTRRASSPADGVTKTTKQTKRVSASPNTGGQVLTTTTTTTVKHDAVAATSGHVKVGDRVLVSGTKAGVLRYIGTTDFTTGQWCGVELDEPLGKNDGTVAGKRYFDCTQKYGLFAPSHKVTKQPGSSTVTRVIRTTRVAGNSSPTSSLNKRSGSHESLGSMSTTSQRSTPGSRVRLGVTSLTSAGQKSNTRPQAANVSATNTALQETLREKEQHIEQLLKERDLERSEVARAAAQVDAAEAQLTALQSEYDSSTQDHDLIVKELRQFLDDSDKQKQEFVSQLEEERRKIEDLEFRLEEEVLSKADDDDDDFETTEGKLRMEELEEELEKERVKNSTLEKQNRQVVSDEDRIKLIQLKSDLEQEKLKSSQFEDICKQLQSQINAFDNREEQLRRNETGIEMLKKQLEEAHAKIVLLEMTSSRDGRSSPSKNGRASPSKMRQIEKEIAIKDDSLLQLQASLDHKRKEVTDLQTRIAEMERELDTTKKRNQRQQEIIDNLNVRLTSIEGSSSNLSDELQDLKLHASDMQRKLTASLEKCDQINHQKAKLEERVSEMASSSGNDNEQLSQMVNTINDKDRIIENLQSELGEANEQVARSRDIVGEAKSHVQREVDCLKERFDQEKQNYVEKLKSLDEELQEAHRKLAVHSSNHADEVERKTSEVNRMQLALDKKDTEIMQFNVKLQETELRADSGGDQTTRLQSELIRTKRDLDQLLSESDKLREEMQDELRKRQSDKEESNKRISQIEVLLKESEEARRSLETRNETLVKEKRDQESMISDRDSMLNKLKNEVTRLTTEFNSHKQDLHKQLDEQQLEAGAVTDLSQQLEQYHKQMEELQDEFKKLEDQNHELQSEIDRLCNSHSQRSQMEEECKVLKNQIELLKENENRILSEHESEKNSLQTMLDNTQALMEQRQLELEQMQTQINRLQSVRTTETTELIENSNDEKRQLENKIIELQLGLSSMQQTSSINDANDSTLLKLQEDNEMADQQIDFLNSVIVDMQKKNDELTSRLQIMETGISLDEDDNGDINLNGIKTAIVAPRLFCDICDVFDLHDTDDCPKQCMSNSPPASQHHANRNEQRPYCNVCEVFGHNTNDCDEGETF